MLPLNIFLSLRGLAADSPYKAAPKPLQEVDVGDVQDAWWCPDGRQVLVALKGAAGVVLRARDGHLLRPLTETWGIMPSRDGRWIVAGREDGTLAVWDRKTLQEVIRTTEGHNGEVSDVDISPDSSKFASGGKDGSVSLWRLATGKRLGDPLNVGSGEVLSLQFSPAGDRLGACLRADDGAVFIWDVSSDQFTQLLRVDFRKPRRFHWSDDGKQALAGSNTEMVVISSEAATLSTRHHPIGGLFLARSGRFWVAFTPDTGARLMDAETLTDLTPTIPCVPLGLSPDDLLVTGFPVGSEFHSPVSTWSIQDMLPKCYTISLINISNMVLIAWYEGRLPDAEAFLTSEISSHANTSHNAYANRALVRARLGDWNAAVEDARTSTSIQPTTMGRIAEAIALSGQGNHTAAILALNFALHNDFWYERELVLLIKAILVFNRGHQKEALAHVTEITRIAFDKRMPRFVEAYMHFLRGQGAMKSRQYDAAIKSFTSAQDLGPFGKVPRLDTIFLLFGWEFNSFWFTLHQHKYAALLAADRTKYAADHLKEMHHEFGDEIMAEKDKAAWLAGSMVQCAKTSEKLGDAAMQSKQLDEAIQHYSAALTNFPSSQAAERLSVERSRAHAEKKNWENALEDAERALELTPSSVEGRECKIAALRGLERYDDAFVFSTPPKAQTDESPGPQPPPKNDKIGTILAEIKAAIDAARQRILKRCPLVVIDTETGKLCDAKEWTRLFEESLSYKALATSRTVNEDLIQLTVEQFFSYVMFSHKWNEKHKEPSFQDLLGKSIQDLPPSPTKQKLLQFLEFVRKAGFRFAWSDTCCINKLNAHVLAESITSMFKWYGWSVLTIVFLGSVASPSKPGDLMRSVWMTRGWTLQELLAPKAILFYDQNWNPYLNDLSRNHKDSTAIMKELAELMRVNPATLIDFRPHALGVREKLRLASTRVTTKEEDIAYCLIGIFSSDIRPHYGEGMDALGLLLQGIVGHSGDATVLAWSGRPSAFNSCLPEDITVYQQSPSVPFIPSEEMGKQVSKLKNTISKETAISTYDAIVNLSPPRFVDRRLSLPCIQFFVTELTVKTLSATTLRRQFGGTESAYSAKVSGIGAVTIKTIEQLPTNVKGGRFVLVHPWLRDLSDPVQEDDWDDDQEDDAHGESTSVPSAPSSGYDIALRLIARLKQRFSALLLMRTSHKEYRRVAADKEIVVQLHSTLSPKDIRVGVVDIL